MKSPSGRLRAQLQPKKGTVLFLLLYLLVEIRQVMGRKSDFKFGRRPVQHLPSFFQHLQREKRGSEEQGGAPLREGTSHARAGASRAPVTHRRRWQREQAPSGAMFAAPRARSPSPRRSRTPERATAMLAEALPPPARLIFWTS